MRGFPVSWVLREKWRVDDPLGIILAEADRLAAVRMLRESGVLHTLADFKALGGLAFKLRDGFVNVGGHGTRVSGLKFQVSSWETLQIKSGVPVRGRRVGKG